MPRLKKPIYSCDFETIVDEKETRVWLWGKADIYTENFEYGTDIADFMKTISKIDCICYFHNLKFDGQFIFYWLFHNGYKHTSSRQLEPGYFSTLISDGGLFYSMKIEFYNGVTVIIYDSLKLIPMAVEKMPDAFGLKIKKLELDYVAQRDINHIPTADEIEYVRHDVLVVAQALVHMKNEGMTKMTTASNALHNYRTRIGVKDFKRYYPPLTLSVDQDCRKSYKGGWTYLNPKYKDSRVGVGRVYDVNSMYPWTMSYCKLPYGEPVYFEGKYEPDKLYNLYIQSIGARFKLKDGKYPSLQLKGSMRFLDTEYIVDSSEEMAYLVLTSVDYELMLENYDIFEIEYYGGYKFRSTDKLFKDYIDYWYGKKKEAKAEHNPALYNLAKLMLNSLYGKFGTNPRKRSKYPVLDPEKDIIYYELEPEEISGGGYIPVAAFITSYARDRIIRAANACGDRFIYADTDSIHIIGEEEPDIPIDDYKLGYFKLESTFDEAKFHRAKCYIESIGGKLDKKCAGLPKRAREMFTFETMEVGSVFHGKLVPKNVKGGTVLVERDFTIK